MKQNSEGQTQMCPALCSGIYEINTDGPTVKHTSAAVKPHKDSTMLEVGRSDRGKHTSSRSPWGCQI